MSSGELALPSADDGTRPSISTQRVPQRSKRGFAAMDPEKQRQIASLGGKSAHQSGHAHQFTSDEAREAGRKRHAKARHLGAATQ